MNLYLLVFSETRRPTTPSPQEKTAEKTSGRVLRVLQTEVTHLITAALVARAGIEPASRPSQGRVLSAYTIAQGNLGRLALLGIPVQVTSPGLLTQGVSTRVVETLHLLRYSVIVCAETTYSMFLLSYPYTYWPASYGQISWFSSQASSTSIPFGQGCRLSPTLLSAFRSIECDFSGCPELPSTVKSNCWMGRPSYCCRPRWEGAISVRTAAPEQLLSAASARFAYVLKLHGTSF